jgi:hypothetical protein
MIKIIQIVEISGELHALDDEGNIFTWDGRAWSMIEPITIRALVA